MTKWLAPLVVSTGALAAWEALVRHFAVPEAVVPGPLAVWQAAVAHAPELWAATRTTALATVAGLGTSVVLGPLIACAFAQSSLLARGFAPYAIFLQAVPLVAIAPLVVLWSGPGFQSVVIVTALVSIFPVIASGITGMMAIDRDLLDLFTVYHASRWRRFWSLRLPHAVPHFLAGAQAAAGLAVVGAIAGEVFAGAGGQSRGLGYLLTTLAAGPPKTPYLFSAAFASMAVGVALFGVIALARHGLPQRWRDR
jgi:NitT/TauT family transport system permease protein